MLCFTGCANDDTSSKAAKKADKPSSSASEKEASPGGDGSSGNVIDKLFGFLNPGESSSNDSSTTDSMSDDSSTVPTKAGTVPASQIIGQNGPKAVDEVSLTVEDMDISQLVTFEDLYGRHALHTGVVGLVGSPVDVKFDTNEITSGRLDFHVVRSELHGIRPDALMFLWYDEENDNYVEQEMTELDIVDDENLDVLLDITKPGVYLLVNKYTWLNAWGAKLDDNGYEKDYVPGLYDIAPSTDWAGNEDTGDILDMIDEQYIMDSLSDTGSADFKVSTPEQLASACYFVNCVNMENGNPPTINITLEKDIDLKGVAWSPIGWNMAGKDNRFKGFFNGGGHTIKNVTVSTGYNTGFFGETCFCYVQDLNIEDADITGANEVGVLVGSDVRSSFSNVSVSGKVKGGDAGAMIGREAGAMIFGCKADVDVNDGSEASNYLSYTRYQQKVLGDEFGYPEKIELKGHKVVRKGSSSEEYHNLQWYFMIDGSSFLEIGANEDFDVDDALAKVAVNGTIPDSEYTVALYAFVEQCYIPVSNVITLDINEFNK